MNRAAERATAAGAVEAVLDNAVWHSLVGPHAAFAEGVGPARRYRPDISVFHAVVDDEASSWHTLANTAGPDGIVVLFRVAAVTPPPGWETRFHGVGLQMVRTTSPDLDTQLPGVDEQTDRPVELRQLHDDDVPAMITLVELTEPGPFRPRTIELGGYVGIFHGDELVAMAGQRLRPSGYCEVSAVCTHPSARRRGYASVLTAHVAANIAALGETPFLHLAITNASALSTYQRIGFEVRTPVTFAAYRVAR